MHFARRMSVFKKPVISAIKEAVLENPVLVVLIVACVTIELVLTLSDWNIIGSQRLRMSTYEYAGFWSGLLGNWQANSPLQPYTMFGTYAFLHSGPMHLVVNMITLWSLGHAIIGRVGPYRFLALYFAAVLGGAAAFGALAPSASPMVGASGGLFGLVGGVLAWNYIDLFYSEKGLWPVARAALMLIGLNIVLWYVMDGQLAWQTHLGGFLAGWIAALLIDPRPISDADVNEH